jgi:ADP-ribose pyrophosphatase
MSDEVRVIKSLHQGRFLELVSLDGWEYARRCNATGVVAIVPVHSDGRYVLVEQYRPAAGGNVIEWPAGLVGDEGNSESHLVAAKRELIEESGYEAKHWQRIGDGLSSAGLTDETVVFFLAKDLTQVAAGCGVGSEDITRHEVSPGDLPNWIDRMKQAGKRIDVKVYAGLAMLHLQSTDQPV